MAIKKTTPLSGLQSSMFDQNAMGENAATYGRAMQTDDQYYRDAMAHADPGVDTAAVIQQQGGAMMEPPGMKVFLQALHEKNAAVTPKSGFVGSHGDYPLESEFRSTFDPTFQTSAVDPASALAGLSQKRKK